MKNGFAFFVCLEAEPVGVELKTGVSRYFQPLRYFMEKSFIFVGKIQPMKKLFLLLSSSFQKQFFISQF